MIDRRRVLMLAALVSAGLTLPVAADEAAWQALQRPGALAVMRHALAPGFGDPPGFALGDCTTQRNLDDAGRAQARAIGQAMRDRGITFDLVLTSQWCRCRETAELLDVGPVEEMPALNSFFADRATRDDQTREVEAFLAGRDRAARILLVTHQVNISALVGEGTSSGEILVLQIDEHGRATAAADILMRP